jgi:hypothetical protein
MFGMNALAGIQPPRGLDKISAKRRLSGFEA